MNNMLSDFVFQSKYSKYNSSLGRKETWEESVERIDLMHMTHLSHKYAQAFNSATFTNDYLEAISSYKDKKFLGSQRGLQFGGKPILDKNCRLFNCSFTYIDRLEVFSQIEWVLLCGCGVGVSVEKQHIDKLPIMVDLLSDEIVPYVIEDSIEGWADAIGALINYYFVKDTSYPKFDFSKIRPNGAYVSGGFIAPGSAGLKKALINIQELLDSVYKDSKRLSSLNCTDIISYSADSVLSGGVRRSALIILFDAEDNEMFTCKTGNWFYENPQRARFNMSAALDRETTPKEVFTTIFKATKEYGEPGFFWRSDSGVGPNPCCEIGFKPVINGKTGFQFCNLVTINGAAVESEEDFYKLCKDASTIATIQASYNDFSYLGAVTEELAKYDPLIGVSIGGIMCNPGVLTDSNILSAGAIMVKQQNIVIADILNINYSSRCTAIKPDGNSSVLLGMTPGCHGEHSKHYIRRVQVNKTEESGNIYRKYNPKSVVDSIWSNGNTDYCIMFPITANEDSVFKNELIGINQLEEVVNLFNSWIIPGMRDPYSPIQNNVSNTVQVDDWDEVIEYVWRNRWVLAGVSFIPVAGDLDYNQPPYSEVLMPEELLSKYGEGAIFASGLIVDAVDTFGDLWKACDAFYGKGEKLHASYEDATNFVREYDLAKEEDFLDKPYGEYITAKNHQYNRWINLYIKMGYSEEFAEQLVDNDFSVPINEIQKYLDANMFGKVNKLSEKREIIRRFNKFACKYFECDSDFMVCALKHVQLYHDWCEITMNEEEIDWKSVKWKDVLVNVDETGAQGCNGGACEIKKL